MTTDFKSDIGSFGIATFDWKGEKGTQFQLIWQADGPWLFGAKGSDGQWLHYPTSALGSAPNGKVARRLAAAFIAGEAEA